MSHFFEKDMEERTVRRKINWYHENLLNVLNRAKENHAREMDSAIALGNELVNLLDEKRPPPIEVPLREVEQCEDVSLMRPVEPEVRKILTDSTEKGGDFRYLKERNKKSPEDKYFFRVLTSWDYGWQQKMARVPPTENHGRCAILRDTFYRKNNIGPDPKHYAQPAGGQFSICSSEYSCINN